MENQKWLLLIGPMIVTIGCSTSDDRLVNYAQQATAEQAKQNEHIARQSEAVIAHGQKLAQAAQDLVEKDAQARREMLVAHRQANEELHAERTSLDRQHEALETERRQIAIQRHRDPIIAATLSTIGLVLAALLPLLVCAYALCVLRSEQTVGQELGELLAVELVEKQSLLLPSPRQSCLPATDNAEGRSVADA